jgi:hypothetical protein
MTRPWIEAGIQDRACRRRCEPSPVRPVACRPPVSTGIAKQTILVAFPISLWTFCGVSLGSRRARGTRNGLGSATVPPADALPASG